MTGPGAQRPSLPEAWAAAALGVSGFLTVLLGFFSPRQAWEGVALAGLIALAGTLIRGGVAWPRPGPLMAVLAVGCVWGLVSALWAPAPARAARVVFDLVTLALAGLILGQLIRDTSERACRIAGQALIAGFAVVIPLLLIERLTGNSALWDLRASLGFRLDTNPAVYSPAGTVIAILWWPALAMAGGLFRKRHDNVGAGVVVALAAVMPFATVSSAAQLGLILGALAAGLVWLAGAWALRVLAVLATCATLAAPWLLPLPLGVPATQDLARQDLGTFHRLQIWAFGAEKVAERPVIGWGLDAARAIPGGDRPVILDPPEVVEGHLRRGLPDDGVYMPLHPHNAALQVWLELGAVGAVIAGAFVWLLFGLPERYGGGRWSRAWLTGLVTTGFVVANLSYGIWQGWWLGVLWAAAVAALVARRLGR